MATAAPTQKQLKENLATHEAQFHQVEAALTNDPENEELLKLKENLTEVIQLTRDLVELAPEPKKRGRTQSMYDWNPGDPCQAIWSESGKYYNAVIDMISGDGETCSITFDGYGTTEIVKLSDLMPQGWDDDDAGASKKRREVLQGKNARQRREEMREHKKKKSLKKKAKQQEVEELREKEKQKWKDFTVKSSKQRGTPLNSKQKRSIFAVPDSLEGKVGVGTCNIGGKGMTGYVTPKNYIRQ